MTLYDMDQDGNEELILTEGLANGPLFIMHTGCILRKIQVPVISREL